MSQTVSYIGASDNRVVSAANLLAQGFVSPDLVWNKANSYENIVSDAIAAYLLTLGSFVIEGNPTTFADLFRRVITPPMRQGSAAWTALQFTTDPGNVTAVAQTFEHGHTAFRATAGATNRGNWRSAHVIPGSPGGYSRIRSRWQGRPEAGGSSLWPQRGHVHGVGIQADGKRRGVVVWHDIVFSAPWILNLGVWESNADGTGFVLPGGGVLMDLVNVSAANRTTNVVTLTVPTGHGFVKDDLIDVDLVDNSYDGRFQITSVTSTTIVYTQTAANAGTTTGTVTLVRNVGGKGDLIRTSSLTAVTRTNNVVTATIPAGHPFQINDWIDVDGVDNTYDGRFRVSSFPSSTQIRWNQTQTDAVATTATIQKVVSYFCESEWRPNGVCRARVWPDLGITGSAGPQIQGEPGWESWWSSAADLTGVGAALPDPARGVGCAVVAGHLSFSPLTEVAYDSIECESLS